MGKNQLCTIAAFNKESEEAAHNIVMQIAAMNPIAIDEAGVPESVKETGDPGGNREDEG